MQSSKTVKINGRAIVVSVIVGLAVTIILLLAISALMQRGKLNEASTGAALIVIDMIAGISGGITARSVGREGGSVNGLLAGLVYAGVIIVVAFLLNMQAPQTAAMGKIFAISLMSGFIGSKLNLAKSNKKLRKKRKS